jgi:hypothetical protein
MSVGPSTSGLGFVFCKAFFQQLAWIPPEHGSPGCRHLRPSQPPDVTVIEPVIGARASGIPPAEPLVGGGRSGIRTHERVAPLTVFKTVAFVRSAILP